MKNKLVCMSVGLSLVIVSGCARDRTIEDYRSDQEKQAEAQVNAVQGDYRGMFVAEDGSGPIGGLSIHVEPDRMTGGASNAPEAEQQAVLKLTAIMDDGSTTMSMTFNGGGFDPGAHQFSASNTVTNRGTASLVGTFNEDGTLTGKLEVAAYPDRGGQFTLSKSAAAAPVKNMKTRASSENKFLFNSFTGDAKFQSGGPAPSAGPSDPSASNQLTMVILKQTSVQDQNFMDVLTPYRTVDISVYSNWTDPVTHSVHQEGGVFPNAIWDVRAGTLVGQYNMAAAGTTPSTELKLSCAQAIVSGQTGWSCQEQSLLHPGILFSGTFLPGGGSLQ